jgi:hypothetical protein
VLLGTIGYVRVNLPQWQKEAARQREERARLEAEYDRIQKADLAAGQELKRDLDAIRDKLGRYPNDEEELVKLRGKPMPLLHPRDKPPRPIIYQRKPGDKSYTLVYRY